LAMTDRNKILLGITGSIAAYKAPELIRRLIKSGYQVKVILTDSGRHLVTSTVLETLSGNPVYSEMFRSGRPFEIDHIALVEWADLVLIAPATANSIGKYASGIADDLLSATIMTGMLQKPILIVPAMNHFMYLNPVVQENLSRLQSHGIHIMEPQSGELACKTEGKGRLPEIPAIVSEVEALLNPDRSLGGRKVLITAGRTIEAIDPVRYLSNFSSGKMGYYLAETAIQMGARVTVISGRSDVDFARLPVTLYPVTSACEMEAAFFDGFSSQDIAIGAAAVCDYRPQSFSSVKLKKSDELQLKLIKNPDIMARAGREKTRQILVGFALETDHDLEYALRKKNEKRMDMIVLNNPTRVGSEMGGDTNQITLIGPGSQPQEFPVMTKKECSRVIMQAIVTMIT